MVQSEMTLKDCSMMINYIHYILCLFIGFWVFYTRNNKYFYKSFLLISSLIVLVFFLSKVYKIFNPLPLWYVNILFNEMSVYYGVYFMDFIFICMLKIIWNKILTKTPFDFENSKIKYLYIAGYGYVYISGNLLMNYGIWLR